MRKKRSELVTIWESVSNVPGWLRLLWLTKQYTEEELDELERIDDEFHAFSREEEIKHRKWLRENLPRTTEGWLNLSRSEETHPSEETEESTEIRGNAGSSEGRGLGRCGIGVRRFATERCVSDGRVVSIPR